MILTSIMDAYFYFLPHGWPKKTTDELNIYNYYIQHAGSNIQPIGSFQSYCQPS